MKMTTHESGRINAWLEPGDDLVMNIALSLAVPRGAWWANPGFGSRLHELRRGKQTADIEARAEAFGREALRWMIDTGKASGVDVAVRRMGGGIIIAVTVRGVHRTVTYQHFVEVV